MPQQQVQVVDDDDDDYGVESTSGAQLAAQSKASAAKIEDAASLKEVDSKPSNKAIVD